MADGIVWVGAYTTLSAHGAEPAQGIGAMRRGADGALTWVDTAIAAPDPSFLLADPRNPDILFAVDEGGHGVQSFRRDGEASLARLGWVAAGGKHPCHLGYRTDRRGGTWLDVSCYGDGTIAVHPVSTEGVVGEAAQVLTTTGSGPHPAQEGPHAHATLRVGELLLSADLGTDEVHVHRIHDDGMLERIESILLPAGSGPRDMRVHPGGVVWVLGEHGQNLSILVPEDDTVRLLDTVPLAPRAQAADVSGDQGAGLSITPNGLRGFVGLRGTDQIAVLASDESGTSIHAVGGIPSGGEWPRHHLLLDEVVHVANERSNTVVSLRLGPDGEDAQQIGETQYVPSATYLLPA